MRATLHFSLLAATLSPSLVQSSPIPFTQNYNSSPRSSAQALSDTSRPGGVLSSRSLLTHGGSRGYGHGLGIFNLGSNNGGDGGDASSGNSYAKGGYVLDFSLCDRYSGRKPVHRDQHDNGGNHPADGGGPPAIDLGPMTPTGDQPQPRPRPQPNGNDASPKPGAFDPGEPAPPHHESKNGIDPNVDDSGNRPPDPNIPETSMNPEVGVAVHRPILHTARAIQATRKRMGLPTALPVVVFLTNHSSIYCRIMVATEATRHRERQPGKKGRLHLFMSLTLTRSKASGMVGVVAIPRTVVPAAMHLGAL